MAMYQNDSQESGGSPGTKWWLQGPELLPLYLSNAVESLQPQMIPLLAQRQWSNRLWSNQNPSSFYGLSLSRLMLPQPAVNNRLRLNVIKNVCDEVKSKVAKNRPQPMVLTSGGHYKEQRAAQKQNQFVHGVMRSNDFDRIAQECFAAAEREGDSFVHVYEEHGNIKIKRVMADEIWADEMQAVVEDPYQLFRIKYVDRAELAALYPEHADAISRASAVSAQDMAAAMLSWVADQIKVCEAWHLRSGPDSDDGLYAVAIAEKELYRERYEEDGFPFAHLRWVRRPWGYFGMGLAEELQPIQYEINRTCATIQESHMAGGSFKIWIKTGGGVNVNELDDEIGTVIESDEMPQYITPQLVGQEVYNFLVKLQNDAYQTGHLTPQSAAGANPLGPEASGAALREMEYIEGDSFQIILQDYERFYTDVARLVLSVARQMWARGMDCETESKGDFKRYRVVRLSELGFERGDPGQQRNKFIMEVFPVSSLPDTPAGRMQTVSEWMEMGMVSMRQGRRLLRFPDFDDMFKLQDATEERIHDYLEAIVDDGEYHGPDRYMDLQLAKELALEYINCYMNHGLEDEKLELLETFDRQVDELLDRAEQAAQAKQLQQLALASAAQQAVQGQQAPAQAAGANMAQ